MKKRRFLRPIFVCLAVIFALLMFSLRQHKLPAPATSLFLLGYTNVSYPSNYVMHGRWLRAEIKWTNLGTVSLVYPMSPVSGNPCALVQTQTPKGWLKTNQMGMTGSTEIMHPGESVNFPIWLPTNTIRWQFSFRTHTPGFQERIFFRIIQSKWANILYPIYGLAADLLPDSRPRDEDMIEIKSKMFEVPQKAIANLDQTKDTASAH